MYKKVSSDSSVIVLEKKPIPNKTNSNKMSIADYPSSYWQGRRVMYKVDYNAPKDKFDIITDDTRITGTLKTLNYLLDNGAKVAIVSHYDRPKGKIVNKFSLSPVHKRLIELINRKVDFIDLSDDHHDGSRETFHSYEAYLKIKAFPQYSKTQPGEGVLFENIRFTPAEENNDDNMAKQFAANFDIVVNDAFAAAHRGSMSNYNVAEYLPACAGFLLGSEAEVGNKILNNPDHPLAAIIGGSKVSSKIDSLNNLIKNGVDEIFIGGGMAYAFLKAKDLEVGISLCDDEDVEAARAIIKLAKEHNVILHLPVDHVVYTEFDPDKEGWVVESISENEMGLDIGPKTVEYYSKELKKFKMIVMNGPMGVYESKNYCDGTNGVLNALVDSEAFTIVGGGDSVDALNRIGLGAKVGYISTGGGAFVELLEGKVLPGIAILDDRP